MNEKAIKILSVILIAYILLSWVLYSCSSSKPVAENIPAPKSSPIDTKGVWLHFPAMCDSSATAFDMYFTYDTTPSPFPYWYQGYVFVSKDSSFYTGFDDSTNN